MAEYTLQTFLRQTPKPLLREYFCGLDILQDLPIDRLKRFEYAPILAAIAALDEPIRVQVEGDFSEISQLCNRTGSQILHEECAWYRLPELSKQLETMENHYARAMWVFLHREHDGVDLFDSALTAAQLREAPYRYARRRPRLPVGEPPTDAQTLEALSDALRKHFREQGRGYQCRVDVLRRPNPWRSCYFAYPEDYSTSELQYERGDLRRRPRKSVFQIVFMFRSEEGTLDISAPGNREEIRALQGIFCRVVLGMNEINQWRTPMAWDLDPLLLPAVRLPLEPADGIEEVKLIGLRLSWRGCSLPTTSFDVDPEGQQTVYAWAMTLRNRTHDPFFQLAPVSARFRVVWKKDSAPSPRVLTFQITIPDGTDLGNQPHHQQIKSLLHRWKIAE